VKDVDHGFSIEMKSKKYVKNMAISDEAHGRVLFEGNLGELLELSFVEGDVLEFTGVYGILRVNISREQFHKLIKKNQESALSSDVGSSTNTQREKENMK
jgi:hypothetical protein